MTSTKTGQAAGATSSPTDLRNVIPAVAASNGITDIGEAIAFYKKHRTAIQAVLGFLKGILGKGKKEEVAQPATPTPAPESPMPSSTPEQGARRIPTSIESKITLIETKRRPREAGGGRDSHGNTIGDHETFKEIVAGTTPTRRGARVHIDNTPSDRFGKFVPGGPENMSLLKDSSADRDWSPNHRIEHIITGGGELTSESDDFGCTPVILIPWEEAPGKPFPVDTGKEWEVTYQARYTGPDGSVVEGNVVRWRVQE